MGICLGWTQTRDISPEAWHRIHQDFQTLADPYGAELKVRRDHYRAHAPLLARFLQPKLPSPAFHVAEITDEAMEVCIGPGDCKYPAWRLERAGGERWFRQEPMGDEGIYQGETLMAALLLVERHAPGVVRITQDDYEPGCWAQTTEWMQPMLGGVLTHPLGAGAPVEVEDEDDDLEEDSADAGPRSKPAPSRT